MISLSDPIWSVFDEVCPKGNEGCVLSEKDRPCRFCGRDSDGLFLMDGNIVCGSCHSLNGRQLDYGAEWRYYGSEDVRASANMTRCSPSMTLFSAPDAPQVLGSVVSRCPRKWVSHWGKKTEKSSDVAAQKIETGRQMQRFQMWNTMSYRDRVHGIVQNTMMVNLSHQCMPSVILEEAKSIYQRLSQERITRGSRREGVIAASVYVACKRCDVPRSIREVADIFNIPMDVMTRAHRLVDHVLGGDNTMVSSEPCHFVGRFCSKLDLPADITDTVRELVKVIDDRSVIYDAMPTSIVAGAILSIVTVRRTKNTTLPQNDTISAVCQVATTTMSKIMKRLNAHPESAEVIHRGAPPP